MACGMPQMWRPGRFLDPKYLRQLLIPHSRLVCACSCAVLPAAHLLRHMCRPLPCCATGRTAQLVAKYRPPMPILTLVVPRLVSDSLKWKLEGR